MGQFVRPGIGAEIEGPGVAHAGVPLIVHQVDAGKAALRELTPTTEGQAVLSGAKLIQVERLEDLLNLPLAKGKLAYRRPFKEEPVSS